MLLRIAYIPMDQNISTKRIEEVWAAAAPIAFITDDGTVPFTPQAAPVVSASELIDLVAEETPIPPALFPGEDNPVTLLLFTSGSTSPIPKGIPLRNSQLSNRLVWQWSPTSPFAGVSGPSLAKTSWLFVDAFTEMFGPLMAGKEIVVPGSSTVSSEHHECC